MFFYSVLPVYLFCRYFSIWLCKNNASVKILSHQHHVLKWGKDHVTFKECYKVEVEVFILYLILFDPWLCFLIRLAAISNFTMAEVDLVYLYCNFQCILDLLTVTVWHHIYIMLSYCKTCCDALEMRQCNLCMHS